MKERSIAGLCASALLLGLTLGLGGCGLVERNPKFGLGSSSEAESGTGTGETETGETSMGEGTGETGPEVMVIDVEVNKDAYVQITAPDDNYGGLDECWVSAAPRRDTLLEANLSDVQGMGLEIVEAQLTFEASVATGGPYSIRPVENMWNEGNVTWNMKPPLAGTPTTQFFPVVGTNKIDLDVFAAIMNDGAAWHGLVLLSESRGELVFASSESGMGPRLDLIVE